MYDEEKWGLNFKDGIDDREQIHKWRQKRVKVNGLLKSYYKFLVYAFSTDTLYSFINTFNFMVLFQIALAVIAVFVMKKYDIHFEVRVMLFVSPIVFPLAFSINTDFQRREKLLQDLAVFKSSSMVWFFCMREWKRDAGLDDQWMTAVHHKMKSILFYLREYLLTKKSKHRKVILKAIYEDFSDASQLIERLRASKLPANTAIVSRAIHLLNMMCQSFELLRVIREYRSPRSIRSFNKVLIMLLPILLSPYFANLGYDKKSKWEPYYAAVLVAFVFSALQGVQDKSDDPFDGIGEDDIKLDTIDEWTFDALEPVIKRTINIGRFTVKVCETQPKRAHLAGFRRKSEGLYLLAKKMKKHRRRNVTGVARGFKLGNKCIRRKIADESEDFDPNNNSELTGCHRYTEIFDGGEGNSRFRKNEARRGGSLRRPSFQMALT